MRPYNPRYLRNRPFFVLKVAFRPGDHVHTEAKGWQEKPKALVVYDQPAVVDRISARTMADATLIYDMLEDKVVKSRFEIDESDRIVTHYKQKYADMIAAGVQAWAAKHARTRALSGYPPV